MSPKSATAKLRSMVPLLVEKTRSKKLRWVSEGPERFAVPLSRLRAQIAFDGATHHLALKDEEGHVVTRVMGGFAELHETARGSAMKADEAIEAAMRYLDTLTGE